MARPHRRQRGFTIIELVVVMAVIGVLMSLGIPEFLHAFKRARSVEAIQTVTSIERSLKEYFNRNGEYPPTSGASNPTGAPSGKLLFENDRPGWKDLDFKSDAAHWYRYSFTTTRGENGRYTRLTLVATGDTDGDGNVLVIQRNYVDGSFSGEFLSDD